MRKAAKDSTRAGKSESRPEPRPTLAALITGSAAPSPLRLDRVALRSATYSEVEPPGPVVPAPAGQVPTTVELTGTVNIFPDIVELRLQASATPDPRYMPIRIAVVMSAFFQHPPEITTDDVNEFVGGAGLRILFPYVREAVSNLTGKGLFGPVYLDPLVMTLEAQRAGAEVTAR